MLQLGPEKEDFHMMKNLAVVLIALGFFAGCASQNSSNPLGNAGPGGVSAPQFNGTQVSRFSVDVKNLYKRGAVELSFFYNGAKISLTAKDVDARKDILFVEDALTDFQVTLHCDDVSECSHYRATITKATGEKVVVKRVMYRGPQMDYKPKSRHSESLDSILAAEDIDMSNSVLSILTIVGGETRFHFYTVSTKDGKPEGSISGAIGGRVKMNWGPGETLDPSAESTDVTAVLDDSDLLITFYDSQDASIRFHLM